MLKIPQDQWKWFGTAGHFICGQWCRFHLATQVGGFLISTVGEFVHPRHGKGNEANEAKWLKENWPGEEIGLNRKYETMVFKAGSVCSIPGCGCGLPEISGSEIDFSGYNVRGEAAAGHMTMCLKYAVLEEDNDE
jgi:hypothetical protein